MVLPRFVDGTYGMGSEMHVDTKHERVDGAIRDTFATKVTAGASGFVLTTVCHKR